MLKTCRPSVFVGSCVVGLAALVVTDHTLPLLVGTVRHSVLAGASENDGSILVHVFDRQGQLVGPVEVPRWHLTDVEWKRRLTPEQFAVSRGKGTERPFCGTLLNNKQSGFYACVGCRLPLFSSDSKYESETGWPSFLQPIAPNNVEHVANFSARASGVEIRCARCGGHLGHVFNDGPAPAGDRYCLNSIALAFTPIEDVTALADSAAEAAPVPTITPGALESSNLDDK